MAFSQKQFVGYRKGFVVQNKHVKGIFKQVKEKIVILKYIELILPDGESFFICNSKTEFDNLKKRYLSYIESYVRAFDGSSTGLFVFNLFCYPERDERYKLILRDDKCYSFQDVDRFLNSEKMHLYQKFEDVEVMERLYGAYYESHNQKYKIERNSIYTESKLKGLTDTDLIEMEQYTKKLTREVRTHVQLANLLKDEVIELGNIYEDILKNVTRVIQQRNILTQQPSVVRTNPKMTTIKTADFGDAGEKAVEYQLSWLSDDFRILKKNCINNYGKSVILLRNSMFRSEAQEFDHIVIGKHGLYLIETKYYKGKIVIKPNGNWIRIVDGNESGENSPISQIDRHHALVKSIVKDIIPDKDIYDIICIAHHDAILEGEENCDIPVIKIDMLLRYIESLETKNLSDNTYDLDEIEKLLNSYKAQKNINDSVIQRQILENKRLKEELTKEALKKEELQKKELEKKELQVQLLNVLKQRLSQIY
ncbi:MAG: NERD domain-containing protein [Lachnospiraceae bacterium]|nr:NERD domain-containing protein [Lachnospiraceae bacterium]